MNTAPAERPRVLVVEDELIVAADIESSLSDLGYDVLGIVPTGKEAVEFAEEQRPDVVIMDIRLAGPVDGITVADEIRRRLNIPSIFLTGFVSEETIDRARAVQPLGYLTKPFRPSELNATITLALHQRRLANELIISPSWLNSLLECASDAVIAVDASGNVRFLNMAAQNLTRWTTAEAWGRPVEEICAFSLLSGDPIESPFHAALRTAQGAVRQRFLISSRDGLQVPVEASTSAIQTNGFVIGAVISFVDISNRLADEEREAVDEGTGRGSEHSQPFVRTPAELRALVAHLLTAQDGERRRLARELHDDIGQRTAALELTAGALLNTIGDVPNDIREVLSDFCADVRQIGHLLGYVSRQLHPSIIEHLGLEPAMRSIVVEHRKLGGNIELSITNLPSDIPHEVAFVLYRTLQETLLTVRQRTPNAPVSVALTCANQELSLIIEGAAFMPGSPLKDEVELICMQERARLIEGSLCVTPVKGRGSRIEVRAPVKSAVSSRAAFTKSE